MDRPEDRLALIEVLDRDGRCLRALDVLAWPFSIGRALDQHLVLDDDFVAPAHVSLHIDGQGALQLQVGNTVNGVELQGQALAAGAMRPLDTGDGRALDLQLGHTRLRLRLRSQPLAAEQRLPPRASTTLWAPLSIGLALLAMTGLGHWINLDPGADITDWLPALVAAPFVVLGWCTLWALLTRLFQQHFQFLRHLRVLLPWLLALSLSAALLPQIAAALAWPLLWRLSDPLQVLLMAGLISQHLLVALPRHPRRVYAGLLSALLGFGALSLTFVHRSADRLSRAPYMSTLPQPAWNWGGAVSGSVLVQELAPLASQLAERVKKAKAEEAANGEEPSD